VAALLLLGAFAAHAADGEPTASPSAAAAQEQPVTAVESLLFESDHLAGVTLPVKLEYRFSWNGAKPFEDRVLLAVSSARHVEVDYLSDGHHVNYPAVDDAHGNPLLLCFLEHDLREMARETGGRVDYFRRLVRRAMAAPGVAIEPISVKLVDREVPASRIRIEPFRADPNAALHYQRLAGKRYEFVFSTAVPGQIVNLSSNVPTEGGETQTARVDWVSAQPL
jgi:hypothetical protein